jgi:hypothetical protein
MLLLPVPEKLDLDAAVLVDVDLFALRSDKPSQSGYRG